MPVCVTVSLAKLEQWLHYNYTHCTREWLSLSPPPSLQLSCSLSILELVLWHCTVSDDAKCVFQYTLCIIWYSIDFNYEIVLSTYNYMCTLYIHLHIYFAVFVLWDQFTPRQVVKIFWVVLLSTYNTYIYINNKYRTVLKWGHLSNKDTSATS